MKKPLSFHSQEIGDQQVLIQAGDSQDILATALANTEVFQTTDQLVTSDLVLAPPIKAHVSETNAVLTQPPIMSTTEQPPAAKNNGIDIKPAAASPTKNLEDSLAVIGVVASPSTNVPVSLELPITVTNPAIAPKATNPLDVSPCYSAATVATAAALMPPVSALELSPSSLVMQELLQSTESDHDEEEAAAPAEVENNGSPALPTSVLTPESDDIIPDTPEPVTNHQTDTNSSEIPLQSNSVAANGDFEEVEEAKVPEDDSMNNNGIDKESSAPDSVEAPPPATVDDPEDVTSSR